MASDSQNMQRGLPRAVAVASPKDRRGLNIPGGVAVDRIWAANVSRELVTWAGHELRPLAEISSVLAYREMCVSIS